MRLHSIVLATLAFAALAPTQDQTQDPKKLEYVALLGAAEISSETVELTADGWRSRGKFDVLGTRKGTFDVTLKRTAKGYTCVYIKDPGEKEVKIQSIYDGESLAVSVLGTKKKKTRKLKGKGPAFMYEDLLFACLIDCGQELAKLDSAGKLSAKTELAGLIGSACYEMPIEHVGTKHLTEVLNGKATFLRVSRIKLNRSVETVLTCTRSGIPLRVEIPAQQVRCTAKGYESMKGTDRAPTSPIDAGPWREKISQPTGEFTVQEKVMVPMRDGVKLAADVYLPKGDGPFPTVMARTPYSRATESGMKGAYYAKRGYAFVAQDVRGRFDSEGEWFPFVHETEDGSDTLDWIAKQKWSNGKVGMVGASYVGLVQWLAAKSGNKHLTCIVPQVSPPDPHENFPYEGGAFLLGAAWWAKVLESMKYKEDWRKGMDWWKVYKSHPLTEFDKNLGLREKSFLDTWLAHPPSDKEFWEPACYQEYFGKIDVPAMHISGWFDGDQPGALQNFVGMTKNGATERARNSQYLVMGPWTHFFNTQRKVGHADFGDEAIVDLDSRIVRFFDHYLKSNDTGIEGEPHVHSFTMGTNKWHTANTWPLPGTKMTPVYLSTNGDASKRGGPGKLALTKPTGGKPHSEYEYDPKDWPYFEVDFNDLTGKFATSDKNDIKDRADDLDFRSPPLETACEIVGPIEGVLWVSTDAADTDFVVGLLRRTKEGKRYAIRAGIQRLRYAKHPREDHPVKPGTVTKIVVDCWATGIRLEKGDQLEVTVSSWVWPGLARNLNTLEPQLTATKIVVAKNRIYHDASRPSHIVLPVVPRKDAPGLSFGK